MIALALLATAVADEGMWLPEQLPGMSQQLTEMGLEIPAEQLADPLQAPLGSIVSLGFCSAAFLSEDGLIGTNHHCVSGYLQYNSTAENNRGEDGYLAPTLADELSVGPSGRLWVVESIEDVTDSVQKGARRRTKDAKRWELVDRNKKQLIATCEEQANRRCSVVSYYGGSEFRLVTKLEIKDIRLVYAPPRAVGDYGGDIDNWMWPRHSGDFSLLRAYVAPDGSSAPYAQDNVPYSPPHHLNVATEGVDDGDFIMVAGYPGRTYRYRTARQMAFAGEVSYPDRVETLKEMLAILYAHSEESEEANARLMAPIGYLENGRKYSEGALDNFRAFGVVERKQAEWKQLEDWIAADPQRTQRYRPVLDEMDRMQAAYEARYPSERLASGLVWSSDLLGAAHTLYRLSVESEKPDLAREAGYQERDLERTKARMERMQQSLWLPADRDVTALLLGKAIAGTDPAAPAIADWVKAQGGLDAALDRLYAEPSLATVEHRVSLIGVDADSFRASQDPWFELAVLLEDEILAPQRARGRTEKGARLRLMPLYMEALLASRDQVYPDANSTLRVTVGHVKGYSPADAVQYTPFTTVRGMKAKASDYPFDAPQNLLDAAATSPESRWADPELGDVPVDFLGTLDITGGNSGSSTLNAKGELVGFVFDGNYESISADWVFDDALTRSIHVDIRYVLWVLETNGAGRILTELGVE